MVDPKDIMNKVLDQANERCNQWNPPAQASERDEWWIDPISDFEDEDCDPVLTAYTRHPGQGPLDFQARLIKVIPASEVEKVRKSEFDRGWKAAIEFANAAWKPILNPKEGGAE